MHGIHQTNAFSHTAFHHQFLHCLGDIYKTPSVWHFKPKMFGKRFHSRKLDAQSLVDAHGIRVLIR